jgi:Membrane dipeptidase (Peptidase family M19)
VNLNITSNIPVNGTNASRGKANFVRPADDARQHANGLRDSAALTMFGRCEARVVALRQALRHLCATRRKVFGFGSDFDGATVPAGIGDAAGLQSLVEIMRTRGYDEPLIEKLCFKNWLRSLGQTWGKTHSISRTDNCDANNSRGSEAQELRPIIGSKQIRDLSMSGLKEVTMAKKKRAKKKTKK